MKADSILEAPLGWSDSRINFWSLTFPCAYMHLALIFMNHTIHETTYSQISEANLFAFSFRSDDDALGEGENLP